MKKPKYLLLGWRPNQKSWSLDNMPKPGALPGRMEPIVYGNARAVIKAACAADCGMLLFDMAEMPGGKR